jgi:hypothetical protein
MHGALVPHNLKQKPPIRYLTSAYTCLSDEEIEDVVMYPTIARMRKYCEAGTMGPAWTINQASIVTKSKSLQEYEIIICGAPDDTGPVYLFAEQTLKEMGVGKRVVLNQAPSGSWIKTIFNEFLDNRRCFIGELPPGVFVDCPAYLSP